MYKPIVESNNFLLRIKNKHNLVQLAKRFRNEVKNIDIDINRLEEIYDGSAFSFFENLTPSQKKDFKAANKLFVKIQPYTLIPQVRNQRGF